MVLYSIIITKMDWSVFEKSFLQIVTHILRKAFFKPAPVREELS